jgi:hypothetical protein
MKQPYAATRMLFQGTIREAFREALFQFQTKITIIFSGIGMRDRDVAPKCKAFREARRDSFPVAADKSKLHGCSFDLKLESERNIRRYLGLHVTRLPTPRRRSRLLPG